MGVKIMAISVYIYLSSSVVDPGFLPGGGANSKEGCEKLLFGHLFPKNCMKLKEFGPQGGAHSWHPPQIRQ